MPRSSAQVPIELTPPLEYLRGEFSLWKYRIPYYSSVVRLSFAEEKFSLLEEIPNAERMEWSLQELFQRDIAWERIDVDLLRYLTNPSQPQFFNALTVALLPRDSDGFAADYVQQVLIEPLADQDLAHPVQVGQIQLHEYKTSSGMAGKIRWDTKKTMAVAVDGQHRLAAIKRLKGRVKQEQMDGSFVPVIFLIPAAGLGYLEPPNPDGSNSAINSLRRIFIDLNKHAKPVSRTRNILLDDQDIVSVCTRSLIGEKLSPNAGKDRIPLGLVDWISESNRIEAGPFITTVLNLYSLVEETIDPWSHREPTEPDDPKITKWLKKVFAPSDAELGELQVQVNRCINQEVPLSFLPEHIKILSASFEREWRASFYRIFSEISPYKAVWDYATSKALLTPEFVNLYAALEIHTGTKAEARAKDIIDSNKANDSGWNRKLFYDEPIRKINDEIKQGHWAFKIVFQKALFGCYLTLVQQARDFVDKPGGDRLKEREEFTTKWIVAINALFSTPLNATGAKIGSPKQAFWSGMGLRADGTVEFTRAGGNRIEAFLIAWVCIYWLDEAPSFSLLRDYNDLGYIASNALALKALKQGLSNVVRARGDVEDDPDKIREATEELLIQRYDHCRKLIRQLS